MELASLALPGNWLLLAALCGAASGAALLLAGAAQLLHILCHPPLQQLQASLSHQKHPLPCLLHQVLQAGKWADSGWHMAGNTPATSAPNKQLSRLGAPLPRSLPGRG